PAHEIGVGASYFDQQTVAPESSFRAAAGGPRQPPGTDDEPRARETVCPRPAGRETDRIHALGQERNRSNAGEGLLGVSQLPAKHHRLRRSVADESGRLVSNDQIGHDKVTGASSRREDGGRWGARVLSGPALQSGCA